MEIPISWILGLIGTLIAAIGALAGYFAWQNRQLVQAFFSSIPEITKVLRDIVEHMQRHDDLSRESHTEQVRALRDISDGLRTMNNGSGRGPL